jgi:hypothetical protein
VTVHHDRVVEVDIDGDVIRTTHDHPFYVNGSGWILAGELRVGARVVDLEGELGVVRTVTRTDRSEAMYDLSVPVAHTFHVGVGKWLVHNCPRAELPPLRPLHSLDNLTNLDYWRSRSTDEIIDSLKPGSPEALRVKSDGTIMNGNTRVQALRERGYDVDSLPREAYP